MAPLDVFEMETLETNMRSIPKSIQNPLSQQELPCNIKKGDEFEVTVCEIFSPDKFWIQLRGPDTSQKFEVMTQMLNKFYNSKMNQERYQMSRPDIVVGRPCALRFYANDNWHRGMITKNMDLTKVRVSF